MWIFASFSGHKMGAMKGIGLLYARKPFAPLLHGGGQERGLRPGTYNYPAIQSFKLAIQDIDLSKQEHVKKLRDYFENKLVSMHKYQSEEIDLLDKKNQTYKENSWEEKSFPFTVNCKKANRLSNTSSIYCGIDISNQGILLHLSKNRICISTSSACNAGSPEPSHVITALGISDRESPTSYANSCIRISLSSSNTKEEIDFLIRSLNELALQSRYKKS